MNVLQSSETALVGRWIQRDGQVVADETSERIEWLVKNKLRRVAQSTDGWTVLYQDPADERFWELTYPESGSHGGGPPTVHAIAAVDARARYTL